MEEKRYKRMPSGKQRLVEAQIKEEGKTASYGRIETFAAKNAAT
jgi:hypothetical protein